MAACLVATGCSSSGSSSTSNCGKVAACGGNVVGTWKIIDACTTSSTPTMPNTSCPGETLQVTGFQASGTLTINTDMTYTTSTSTTASLQLVEPVSCLMGGTCSQLSMSLSSSDGGTSGSCTTSGANCNCTGTFGGGATTEMGAYTVSGTTITTTPANGTSTTNSYCVQGTMLHIISLPMGMGTSGLTANMDIVAAKQ